MMRHHLLLAVAGLVYMAKSANADTGEYELDHEEGSDDWLDHLLHSRPSNNELSKVFADTCKRDTCPMTVKTPLPHSRECN